MVTYIVRRLLLAVLTVWAISVLSFIIIHLPPGDYVTSYIALDVGVGQRGFRRRGERRFANSSAWTNPSPSNT